MSLISRWPALLAIMLLTGPDLAAAQSDDAVGHADTQTGQSALFGAAGALTVQDLQTMRGGYETLATVNAAVSEQFLLAENHGNTIDAGSINNGPVTIGPGALQGFSGLGNFVINTGNNNNLQGTLSVSVFMTPSAP